ncbi:MAG TPA: substrate-binding domain-containing protein [Pseudolabrys sp.]|nr:substrate-binding domain-containing protein [Pseudolabrys sp.]
MATIRVLSGGAPKEIFLRLTPEFERQTGHRLDYVFAVMSALREKIASGDKADVLVMPTNILDGYQKDGVVRAEGRAVLGLVSINAVVRTGAKKPDLSTPDKVKQVMLNSRAITHATPGATPSGTHMGKLIETLGIASAMKDRIIHRPALEGGVQLVASGEAEIGFYPKSEVVNTDGLTVVGPLPAAIQLTTIYGAAVTKGSAAPDAGAAFIAFMSDAKHRGAWSHAGFDPAP